MDVRSRDGTRLSVTVRGPGAAPAVVLVHGLGLSAGSWEQVAARLEGSHRVVTYDLRGHGASERSTTGDYGIEAHAADLDAVLTATVDPAEPAVLVGHSLGGQIILRRGSSSLDGIRGVVFAGSVGSVVTVPGLPGWGLPAPLRALVRRSWLLLLLAVAHLARAVRGARGSLLDRIGRRAIFAPGDPAAAVTAARRDFLDTEPGVLGRTAFASVSEDGSRFGPGLRVPALILYGDCDSEISAEDVQLLASRLPEPEVVTLCGLGHMMPTTHPDVVAGHVAEWVRRTTRHDPARSATPEAGAGRTAASWWPTATRRPDESHTSQVSSTAPPPMVRATVRTRSGPAAGTARTKTLYCRVGTQPNCSPGTSKLGGGSASATHTSASGSNSRPSSNRTHARSSPVPLGRPAANPAVAGSSRSATTPRRGTCRGPLSTGVRGHCSSGGNAGGGGPGSSGSPSAIRPAVTSASR